MEWGKRWCLMACAELDRKEGRKQYTVPATYIINVEYIGDRPLQTFACSNCAKPFEAKDKMTIEEFRENLE